MRPVLLHCFPPSLTSVHLIYNIVEEPIIAMTQIKNANIFEIFIFGYLSIKIPRRAPKA